MTRKRWAVLTLVLLIGALCGLAASVVIVDPFEIYRQATAFIPPIASGTQSYSNAGIAKSYDYDSIVIGTSMTENFRPSQLDTLFGGRFVKLCINGGTPFNHRQMMEMAFSTHDVQRVLYGIDPEGMTHFYKTPKAEMPEYLYDDNLFNDVRYWFNQSVLARYIPACLRTLGQSDPDLRDTMYAWGDDFEYGKDAVLRHVEFSAEDVPQEPIASAPEMNQQTRLNVEHNILPFVTAHPDTEFIFFYPPYSLVRWYEIYRQGNLNTYLNQKEAVIDCLLAYDNVRIYDFQAQLDWILDLALYVDPEHYAPHINDAIAEMIAGDQCRITGVCQAQENDAVLRDHVSRLLAAGWDFFD